MSQRAHKLLRRLMHGQPVSKRVKREYYALPGRTRAKLNNALKGALPVPTRGAEGVVRA